MTTLEPRAEYARRLDGRRRLVARMTRQEIFLANLRLTAFLAAGILAWLGWVSRVLSPAWAAAPFAVFLVLVFSHDRVIRARRVAERAVRFYEQGIARLENRWMGTGESGSAFLDPRHPYAEDLDLFGPGSVFELLCAARTQTGQSTLAGWLLTPAPVDEILTRQEAVRELAGRLDLREGFAIVGEDVRTGVEPARLAAWSVAPPVPRVGGMRIVAPALALAALASFALWVSRITGPQPLILVILAISGLSWRTRREVERVLRDVDRPSQELRLLGVLLGKIEAESFSAAGLNRIRDALDVDGAPPSRRVTELARLVERVEWRANMFFAPIAFVLLWGPLHALAIERWRGRSGAAVARWLDAAGAFEALASLGSHSFEHPGDPFPEIIDGGCAFDARQLGHPLIPEERCARNDLAVGSDLRLLIVSGSNMSGKSTLLRAVGVNAVLALAGAPVRAARLRITPLAVGASISRQDSLQEGISRFYAEIQRLRQLLDLTGGSHALLFLIDEILNGTNSHDRRIGAEGVLRGFLDRGAIGLVTTHDLAITQIADSVAHLAANVHFEDQVIDGRVLFDYRLRSGIVTRSNALSLMRAVGLDVAE